MSGRSTIVIVGGGISGLAAAHYLARRRPEFEVVVIEQDRQLGGKIRTEHVDGFVVEGGPDSFLSSKARGLGLAQELGLKGRLQGTNEEMRRTWVMFDGRLHDLPAGLSGLVPSRLEPLLDSDLFSPEGKARLGREPSIPARSGNEDESLASFIVRRFGGEVYERMIEPLMSGIYAGDGTQLSLAATFPQLRRLEQEFGSIIEALRATQQGEAPQAGRSPFMTFMGGMAELVYTLQQNMPSVRVSTGTGATTIRRDSSGFAVDLDDGARIHAAAVILAAPAYAASKLLAHIDDELSATLASIPLVSSATVSLAYAADQVPRALQGYGYVVPRREGRPVMASTWSSTKFAHRAPPGYALLRFFIGRAGAEEALAGPDSHLVELARSEVMQVLGTTDAPIFHRVFRWPLGMPQYTMGHLERISRIESRLHECAGLYLAGNSFRGVGIPDCVDSGERAAWSAAHYIDNTVALN